MNMSASTPHFAPLVVLLFLGTIFLLGTALLVLFCGAVRRSAFFAKLGAFRGRRGRVRSARAKLDAAHQSPAAGRVVYDGSRVRRAERRARAALARQRR